MLFQFNSFSLTLLMSGVAALLTALLIFQRMGGAVRWFAMMMVCVAIWSVCYAFELSCSRLEEMMFWVKLQYIGISFLPATWIIFVMKFTGKQDWLTFRNWLIIFVFPVFALLFVWTNSWHHIHYESAEVDESGPFPLLAITPGIWYHVHTVYFYFMLAWGILLLLRKFRMSSRIYRWQNSAIIIGAFIPWVFNLVYLMGVRPFGHIDLTPYAFIITSVVIGFGLVRFSLFDLIPIAREKIIENMHDGMLILDSHTRIIDANQQIRRMLFPLHVHVIGKKIAEIFPYETLLIAKIDEGKDGRQDIVFRTHDTIRHFEVDITAITDPNTIKAGTLLIFGDITERVEVQSLLQQQADELRSLNHVKDKLFTIISHDLRSPLASLTGILEFAESGDLSEEEFRQFLPSLAQNVENTSRLIENLLFWSKSQLEGESIHPELFDLKDIVEQNVDFFTVRAAEKKICLAHHVTVSCEVFADKSMIQLVLRNLVSNAIKFCNEGDRIDISCNMQQGSVTLSVRDTGVGMNEGTLRKVLGSEGYTSPGTRKEHGTGLGLMLCREFIQKNKGRFEAESAEGIGSVFSFTLPSVPY
jgi:PAS domain S-box-containing protein